MPQASDDLNKEWNGPGEETAVKYLKDANYTLTWQYFWVAPIGHTPIEKELRAIRFLIDEWDYGGLIGKKKGGL